jgi:hypothetical protein
LFPGKNGLQYKLRKEFGWIGKLNAGMLIWVVFLNVGDNLQKNFGEVKNGSLDETKQT